MTTRVASIIAEIGLDSSKFASGMKEVLGSVNNFKSEFEGISRSGPIFAAALGSVGSFALKSAENTAKYADEVDRLGRLIGETPEKTSELIQVANDLGIPFNTLEKALENAVQKGLDPSVEGLGKMREEYQSIKDPLEKTNLLMDTFGKTLGNDVAPIMKISNDEFESMAEDANKLGLAMSGKNLEAARAYVQNMDDLQDKLNAVGIRFGNDVIPSINWMIEHGEKANERVEGFTTKWGLLLPVLGGVASSLSAINELNGLGAPEGARNRNEAIEMVNASYRKEEAVSSMAARAVNGFAEGGDFVVPPGYPNDSFPMRVQSGERVQVTPYGKTPQNVEMSEIKEQLRELNRNMNPRNLASAIRDAILLGEQ